MSQTRQCIIAQLLTLAALYSTTFLLVKSDLLPTSSLFTPSDAYRSISCSHCLTFEKVSAESINKGPMEVCWALPLSVTSYTTMIPCAPR